MKKLTILVMLLAGGVAVAGPGSDAGAAAPASGGAPTAHPPAASGARQACVDVMNADPSFAKSIIAISDKQLDEKTIAQHVDADQHIQKNEKHVFFAYAVMWVVAALFVLFLWIRQQKLLSEIATLRRDLEAAAKDGTAK
jgi:hypothetical protein